jgi:PAS domain S-box-containing protein
MSAFDGDAESPEERVANGLRIGTDYLDIELGFLTRIDGDTQRIVQSTGSHPLLQPGEECPLEQAYCRRTLETEGTLSVQSAGSTSAVPTEAVETFGLETYIGATVTVDGDRHGTICFADRDPRAEPFSDTEELFVELLAERIGNTLERQSYEEALARRNERLEAKSRRFQGIAATSPDVIFRVDDAGAFTYVSPAIERLLGYDPQSLVGESFAEVIAPDSVEEAFDLYRRVSAGEPAEGVELGLESADGEQSVFEINARPADIPDGGYEIQGIARDVTDRKKRQRELEVRNRAMDEAGLGIVIADATREDNPITYVNEEFCRITGYDRDRMLGSNCRVLQGEATDAEAVAVLREAIDADEPVSVDIVNYRDSGCPFWNEVSVTPVENATGEVVQYIGFQRDVTGRKRRRQLLNVMNRVLRHNLRNRLTVLLGAGCDAGADTDIDGAKLVREAAEDLLSLAERARELHSYAEADRDPVRIDPAVLFSDVREAAPAGYPEADVTVDVATDRDIVAGGALRAAVVELVENALEHDPDPDTTVELSARDDGDEVVLAVADDGPGLDGMERDAIETGRESPLSHGTGLGLWFVNWAVTRYGGSFRVRPREGGSGSVATVRLPAVGDDEAVDDAARGPTILAE